MTQNNPLSRRALLAISAAAVAGTASCSTSGALAKAIAPSPDAELIALCAQLEALRAELHKAGLDFGNAEQAAFDKHRHLGFPDVWGEVHRDPAYMDADSRTNELVRKTHPLFRAVGQMRAVTLEGIMAKARVTAGECLDEGGVDAEAALVLEEGITPQYMALTLVRHLLAMRSAGEA